MRERKHTRRIIFHHSLSKDVSVDEIRRWHKERGFYDVGYHYVIRADGKIETGRGEEYIGAHAKGRNKDSIGVCLPGDFRTDPQTTFQTESSRALYYSLCKKYDLLKIEFHRADEEPCPGVKLDREGFVYALRSGLLKSEERVPWYVQLWDRVINFLKRRKNVSRQDT